LYNSLKFIAPLKSFVFWDRTPWSLLKVNRRCRGTCRLHIQVWRISQSRD
jgi:hypothetical protein